MSGVAHQDSTVGDISDKSHLIFALKVSERVTDEGPEVDDGLVEEVAEALVEGVEAVSEHLANCEVAGKVGEAIEDVCGAAHDTLREGVGMGAEGIHAAGRALNGAGEEVASQFIETEQMIEAATNSIGEIALDSLAEEAAETAADMLPVVGAIMPTYNLIDGSLKTVVGAGGLVVGGTTAVLGGLVGAVAAPFDGGATWGGAMNVSRRTSAWSASVAGEGTLTAAKGAAGLCNQVILLGLSTFICSRALLMSLSPQSGHSWLGVWEG